MQLRFQFYFSAILTDFTRSFQRKIYTPRISYVFAPMKFLIYLSVILTRYT